MHPAMGVTSYIRLIILVRQSSNLVIADQPLPHRVTLARSTDQ